MLKQREFALPFPELSADLPLLPARMLNEYEYCPRLSYLEWVQGEWSESADTVEGRFHQDQPGGELPAIWRASRWAVKETPIYSSCS